MSAENAWSPWLIKGAIIVVAIGALAILTVVITYLVVEYGPDNEANESPTINASLTTRENAAGTSQTRSTAGLVGSTVSVENSIRYSEPPDITGADVQRVVSFVDQLFATRNVAYKNQTGERVNESFAVLPIYSLPAGYDAKKSGRADPTWFPTKVNDEGRIVGNPANYHTDPKSEPAPVGNRFPVVKTSKGVTITETTETTRAPDLAVGLPRPGWQSRHLQKPTPVTAPLFNKAAEAVLPANISYADYVPGYRIHQTGMSGLKHSLSARENLLDGDLLYNFT